MNRKLLALAIGAALALPVAAQAAPSFYGKLDVSTEHLDGDRVGADVSETTLESNKSRIGVRGEEKLSNDLSVVYQVEWGVSVDGDSVNGPDLSQRDRFLGLKHNSLGTLRLGRLNTPLKEAEGPVDVFNGTRLDMENVFAGQERESNSIAYSSPTFADAITARLTHITEEGTGTGTSQSASLVYDRDGLYLALGLDNDVVGDADDGTLNADVSFYGPSVEADTIRLVAGIDLSGLRLGALYQQSEAEGAGIQPEQTGYLLSAAYTLDKWTFKGQFAASEGELGPVDLGEITQLSVGADYQWTQSFKTYGFLGKFEFDQPAPAAETDLTLIGVGMALSI
jgi:predicted porin